MSGRPDERRLGSGNIDAIREDAKSDPPKSDRRMLIAEIDRLEAKLAAIKVRVTALRAVVSSLIDGEATPEEVVAQIDHEGPGAGGGHWT